MANITRFDPFELGRIDPFDEVFKGFFRPVRMDSQLQIKMDVKEDDKSYTVKFEFLDKEGKVLAAKEVTVGPVEPKKSAPFAVEVNQTGIVSFRYAPF